MEHKVESSENFVIKAFKVFFISLFCIQRCANQTDRDVNTPYIQ